METMHITTGFAWKPEPHVDTKHVQLLISKAEDIYQDHFDDDEVVDENEKYSTYNLEQWNADGGSFCVCPSLEPGVYQFVFRVDNGKEKELKVSDYYERTFLGSGRAVNYIELIGYSKVDQSTITSSKRKLRRSHRDSSDVGSTSTKKSYKSSQESKLIINSTSDSQRASKCAKCTLL